MISYNINVKIMTNKKSSCEKQLLFLEPKAGLETRGR